MANPFNPLDWVRSAQDWFSKTERSSGFRPYLIFFLLCVGTAFSLLLIFQTHLAVQIFALALIGLPALGFVGLFAWKAEKDPNFCRSESHVQKIWKYELEVMGNETKQIEGEVLESNSRLPIEAKPKALPTSNGEAKRP